MGKYRLAIITAVFCLPFTQAPTFKFFMRWRISELIAWIFLPFHLKMLRQIIKSTPSPIRWVLWSMGAYFIYTGLIGIAYAPFAEVRVEAALEYFISPVLRTFLETARGFASVSLLIGLLTVVRSRNEFERLLKVFVWSGAISGGYNVYQASVLSFGLPLPLLPGTLYHESYARPFGTFYEPTGAGSFTAVTTLLTLYFLFAERRPIWLICLTLNGLGFFVSLARAGWIGLLAGGSILLLILILRHRSLFQPVIAIVIAVGIFWLGYLVAVWLFGEFRVWWALSSYWLEYSWKQRAEGYAQVPFLIREFLIGAGQGLLIFHSAGAPGFIRLLLEGGLIGSICILVLHFNIIRCLLKFLRYKPFYHMKDIYPFLAASYLSCFITTFNYINVTDMWIWFVWTLPAIYLWVDQQEKQNEMRKDEAQGIHRFSLSCRKAPR